MATASAQAAAAAQTADGGVDSAIRWKRLRTHARRWLRLDLERLQWITLIAPPVFFIVLAVGSYLPHQYQVLGHEGEHVLMAAILIAAALAFSPIAFHVIRDAQRRLAIQNAELGALHAAAIGWGEALDGLHRAALAVTSELSLEAVLQRVVDLSRELVHAKYGALAVRGTGDEVQHFVASGLSSADAARIHLPADGQALLGSERGSPGSGSPADSDPTHRLRIPILFHGRDIGVLFLVSGSGQFSEQEAKVLSMFALQAAIAIENARLYAEVQRVAVLEERERIARDMHDGLGQLLGYLNTKAQAVRELLAAGRYDAAGTQVGELAEAAQELHGDMREAISGLRPDSQLGPGLVLQIREIVQRFRERSGLPVRVEAFNGAARLSWGPAVDTELTRIVQEALTNVRKHAHAQRAWVRVRHEGDAVVIHVDDDGQGFDAAQRRTGSFGLNCMAERATNIGARLSITSEQGRGTRVEVQLEPPTSDGDRNADADPGR